MKSAKSLKEKINNQTMTTGVLVTNHLWPDLVDVCVNAGLDYMIVDMEHGAFSPDLVADVCAIGRRIDFAVLVRPITHDVATIRKTVDMGACGMLLPGIDTPEMLDEVRDGIYMPPRGQRRPGGLGNRWIGDFSYSTWKAEVEDDLIVLPQIETRRGLDHVEEIARHDIVTAMAIGPYDLSADLGACGEMTGPEVMDATGKIREAARSAGKNMWVIGDGPTLAGQGFTFICVAEPTMLLEITLKGLIGQVKSG